MMFLQLVVVAGKDGILFSQFSPYGRLWNDGADYRQPQHFLNLLEKIPALLTDDEFYLGMV